MMASKTATLTAAAIRRYIKAARAEDPRAIIELVTPAGTVRIMPEAESPAADPFDQWRAKRDARQAQGH